MLANHVANQSRRTYMKGLESQEGSGSVNGRLRAISVWLWGARVVDTTFGDATFAR